MEMDKKTFNAFRTFIYNESGFALGDGKEALVASRANKRMRTLECGCYNEYLEFLTNGNEEAKAELVEFLSIISTNITEFFREEAHFHFMGEVIKKMVSEGRESIRIWSAKCSSGEEPYSIAMTFLEAAPDFRGDCKILATDISTNVLARAIKGEYIERKMNNVSQELRNRYFSVTYTAECDKIYKVNKELTDMIRFARIVLGKPPFPMKGPFDIIFCTYALLYFDEPVRKRLIAELERLLRPGGYLIIDGQCNIAEITTLKSVAHPTDPFAWFKGDSKDFIVSHSTRRILDTDDDIPSFGG